MTPDRLRTRLKDLPERCGVYLFKDRDGRPLYIGKALSLKKRVAGHFRRYGELSSKEGLMLSAVWRVDVIETPSEAEALLLEASLVKEQMPKYNQLLRDDKSYPYLKVTDEEYPRLLVARPRKADGAKYFGPYTSVYLLRQAVRMLRREFPLRTCRKMPKKVCLQYHLGLCGGPCEAHQPKQAYLATVRELVHFLDGRRDALVRSLSKRMKACAASRQYEKAQAMRDAIRALAAVPASVRAAKTRSEVLVDFQAAFSLPVLPRRIECFDISNIQGREAVGSMVVFEDGEPLRRHYRRFRVRTVEGIDDYRMMREVVRRRYTGTLSTKLPRPDLVLIDGGKGHLSAVKTELDGIGLAQLPLLAIAKQHEILFAPGRETPYVLPPSSPVLHLVRHLRDEAHRFAIQYHRRLHRGAMLGTKGGLMKRTTALAFAAVFLAVSAHADMLEVKDRGFLNGEVVSQDDKEVQFKDAQGDVHTFPKKDVLFMEIDKADTGTQKAVISKTIQQKAALALEAAKKVPRKLKQSAEQATRKFTSSMSKPLDRSYADSQSQTLNRAMDQASQASTSAHKKVLTANEELKRQQQRGEQGENRVKSSSGYVDNYDPTKGRFGSLD